jgi:hypothetical protein
MGLAAQALLAAPEPTTSANAVVAAIATALSRRRSVRESFKRRLAS